MILYNVVRDQLSSCATLSASDNYYYYYYCCLQLHHVKNYVSRSFVVVICMYSRLILTYIPIIDHQVLFYTYQPQHLVFKDTMRRHQKRSIDQWRCCFFLSLEGIRSLFDDSYLFAVLIGKESRQLTVVIFKRLLVVTTPESWHASLPTHTLHYLLYYRRN